jgi:hypothetical protein
LTALLMASAASAVSRPACAQRVYVYGPAPAPPPPPPPPYYRPYYVYREPPYAFVLGVDFDGAAPVSTPQFADGNDLKGGGGMKIRAGERIRLQPGLHITPEVGYGYTHLFATDDNGNAYDWDLHRIFAGARLEIGRFFVPALYGHVGYGWQVTGDPTVQGTDGPSFDVGGALDLRVIPHLGLGVHVEYVTVAAEHDSIDWVAVGLHASIVFF